MRIDVLATERYRKRQTVFDNWIAYENMKPTLVVSGDDNHQQFRKKPIRNYNTQRFYVIDRCSSIDSRYTGRFEIGCHGNAWSAQVRATAIRDSEEFSRTRGDKCSRNCQRYSLVSVHQSIWLGLVADCVWQQALGSVVDCSHRNTVCSSRTRNCWNHWPMISWMAIASGQFDIVHHLLAYLPIDDAPPTTRWVPYVGWWQAL